MEHGSACKHLVEAPELEILMVLDAYLEVADAYAKCARCDAHYLIEMIDLSGQDAAFRVARLPAAYVARTIKSMQKGSCDINRARSEAMAVKNAAERLPLILFRREGKFAETIAVGTDAGIPQASWRELPCDGSWLRRAGSA